MKNELNIDNCKTISEKLSNGISEEDNMVDIIHDIRNDVYNRQYEIDIIDDEIFFRWTQRIVLSVGAVFIGRGIFLLSQ